MAQKAYSNEDIGPMEEDDQSMLALPGPAGGASNANAGWEIMKYDVPPTLSFQIIGDDCQVLNIETKPGDSVVCEPGCMMHMSMGTTTATRLGPCCGCYQCCGGESIFKVRR